MRIVYMAAVMFLVLATMSSTSPSFCQAGGCIGCPRAPPPPSDETCYEDLKCSASRCHLGCIHRGYKGTGSYCRGRDCCCKH
ncbi:basal endosperm transfer layer 3 precursor [Zea mays]|uniref:BETL3 protein n=1 Tax=Zea mays TaxID=4577 RepID=A0A1D6MXK7_MAIZE|nr:basal endosperm transfer layer 3 precursor [Zea mays]ONM33458.1 BETL3 protein [Zea mays]|eukprot:NP_001105121.2 basal endosperm transfer layer 3 precursor [Zea mays]